MKANELMIGDWIKHAHYESPCKVVAISTDITVQFDEGAKVYEALEFVQPIPLTAEILKKNFRKDEQWGHAYFLNDHIHIYEWEDFWQIQYAEIVEIRHVHELQHALKLCGFEKNIEI